MMIYQRKGSWTASNPQSHIFSITHFSFTFSFIFILLLYFPYPCNFILLGASDLYKKTYHIIAVHLLNFSNFKAWAYLSSFFFFLLITHVIQSILLPWKSCDFLALSVLGAVHSLLIIFYINSSSLLTFSSINQLGYHPFNSLLINFIKSSCFFW